MKRKITVFIVALMSVIMALTLVACGNLPKPNKPTKPTKVEPEARTQVETRTDAYTAYKADGTEIGSYKSIGAAINAAVATDEFGSNNATREDGSYVEYLGKTIFENHNGYAEASDDMFYFYVNGNQWEAYDCFNNTMYADYLKNNKVITHEVTARGSTARQYHNGYAMFNPDGTMNEDTTKAAQSWELSSTMDAAALTFPARLKGITGLSHEIDLSGVQIKPNYEGTDATYAFIGYYAWQDYYVIATGIACDVQTGAWYPFNATSRDDSFSDAEYKMGDSPLMISNWNEEGGYWTPEYASLKMYIKTVRNADYACGFCSESNYEFYTADGTLDNEYNVLVDEALVNEKFSGAAYGIETSYVFIAGLDVRTPTSVGVYSYNTDYTNGAEFKNLQVTAATAHVPSDEEMEEVEYGFKINPDWRGNDYNVLMAAGEHEEGIIDYTLLNTYACADYQPIDGRDVYSFSYAGSNVAETPIGGIAGQYQATIDALKAATPETVVAMEAAIEAVNVMYNNGKVENGPIAQKFYPLLDFAPLFAAQQMFSENAPLSEKAAEFAAAFNELPSLLEYNFVGWKTEEAEATGYLMNDVAAFKALYDQYSAEMTEDDVARWKHHVNLDNYNMYVDLMNMKPFEEGFAISAKEMGKNNKAVTYTGEEAMAQIAITVNKIKAGTAWDSETENCDPNSGKVTLFNSDNNWLPAYHVMYLKTRLEEAGYELPIYLTKIIEACGAAEGFMEDFYYIDTVLTLAKGIETGAIKAVDEAVAAKVNAVMVGKTAFVEAGLVWNWNNCGAPKDFLYRAKNYHVYYGLESGVQLQVYIETVQSFLAKRVGAEANGIGITAAVEPQDVTITDEAAAVIALFDAKKMHGADFEGYNAALEAYAALSESDKILVATFSDYEELVELMEGHKNALEAVVLENVAPITVYEKIYYGTDTPTKQMTASEALYQLNELICKIQGNTPWTSGVDSDCGAAYTILDYDHTSFQGIRIIVLRQYLENAGVTLPAYFADIFTAIAYDDFFQAYDAIYQTVRLATTYAEEGKTVANMTEEDKAIFEKYWGPAYEINHHLKWNWNSGNKFETYMSARVRAIALQYKLAAGISFGDQFGDIVMDKWKYGDCLAEYTYKGETYYSYVYEDEAASRKLPMGALIKGMWAIDPIYVDANGEICAADAEGATRLMTTTEGVVSTGKIVAENCSPLETQRYVTADGMFVYKRSLWTAETGSYITTEEDYVDQYNRNLPADVDVSAIKPYVTVKVFKFYDVMCAWLNDQGYVTNTNGWGYATAPNTQA